MLLADGERSVGQIVTALHLPQPLVSYHLKALKDAGLLTVRRDGRCCSYAVQARRLVACERSLAHGLKP